MFKPALAAAVASAAALLLLPGAAIAAPPANDVRTSPVQIGALPTALGGTTVDATRDETDPFSPCATTGVNVWYRFTAPADGRVAVRLMAQGDLDAALDAYLSERSQTRALGCDVTDSKGLGGVDFTVKAGESYLIAVTALPNSVNGTFSLTIVAPQPPERAPGQRLRAGGASGTLDRVGNVQDAYSLRLREGRTYRFRLSGRSAEPCFIGAALYGPGTTAFDGRSVKRFGCDAAGYTTFTPGPDEGGRYSVLLTAQRGVRYLQRYHLEAAGAGRDDLAPGRFLANRATVAGTLNGARVDALDLYRFSVAKRSDLTLKLAAGERGFDLLLLNERGRRVQCVCSTNEPGERELRRQLAAGRYFVAVRARDRSRGGYRLSRASRVLTRTRISVERRRIGLGTTAQLRVRVRPEVTGPVTVVIQRFDPLEGWLFSRRERTRAVKGQAQIGFRAPTVGRWRARATFDGTIGAGSSETGFAELLVVARRRG